MEYVVCLKKEIELYSERDAQKRYLELTAMGYKEQDILWAAPVPVHVQMNIGQNTVAQTNPAMTSSMMNNPQNAGALGYPMSMPSAHANSSEQSSSMAMATENGGFEPVQTDMGMSLFRDNGEPGPNDELPSDTIS